MDLDSGAYEGSIEGILTLEKTIGEIPEGVVLRYGTLYGPGTWFARDGAIANLIRQGDFVATGAITSFVFIEDAAQATVLAINWPKGIVNIADDEPAPDTEWAPVFAAAIGAPPPPSKPGSGRGQRGVSNTKARRELGWQPIYASWREGFKRVLGDPGAA